MFHPLFDESQLLRFLFISFDPGRNQQLRCSPQNQPSRLALQPLEARRNKAMLIMGGTLPETNSSHLTLDGWKMILSFWVERPIFRCELLVSGRVGDRETKPTCSPNLS